MIESLIFVAVFIVCWLISRSNTYAILAIASVANVAVYPLTLESSVFVEATLTILTLSVIMAFGDKDRAYQSAILFGVLLCLMKAESIMVVGIDPVGLGFVLTVATVMQAMGAFNGMVTGIIERLYATDSDRVLRRGRISSDGAET